MISKEALEEYKKIYKADRGIELSDEEALAQATNLLNIINLIYRPVKKEWLDDGKTT